MSRMSLHQTFICPDCGGPLFENDNPDYPHFHCRIGHAYSLNALLAGQDDALEAALWAAVPALQENADLKQRTVAMLERNGKSSNAARIREDAEAQMDQAKLLRMRIVDVQKRTLARTGTDRRPEWMGLRVPATANMICPCCDEDERSTL
jgi:two-component system, chemotaxis family, protein-glutamate methylesterase/glutaminase